MNFWKDGIDLADFEKLVLGFLFIGVVVIAAIKYFITGDVSINWVSIIGFIGGLFVARKAFSYFKPVTYNSNNSDSTNDNSIETDNTNSDSTT